MSASSWFIGWILLSETFLCWSEYQRNISAEPGESVTLPCQHPDNYTVIAVEWSRTDLGDKYVLLYRDEQIDKSHQEPSFSDRADLQDRLMEGGHVSLVLEDVKTYDTGTYECRVVHSGLNQAKLDNGPICTIHLDVAPPPGNKEDGDSKDENYEQEENLDEGNKDEGNKDEGNKDEGNKNEGNKDEGNKDEGNKDEENKDERNKDKVNLDEGNKDEGNQDEGNKDKGNKDEENLDEGNQDKVNLDEGNKDEGNRDEGNKDEGTLDEGINDEENQDEENQDEGNKEGVKEGSIVLPVFLMLLVFTVAFLIVRVRCVRPRTFRGMMPKRRLI